MSCNPTQEPCCGQACKQGQQSSTHQPVEAQDQDARRRQSAYPATVPANLLPQGDATPAQVARERAKNLAGSLVGYSALIGAALLAGASIAIWLSLPSK